jgi:molecular chaperone DnaK
MRGGDPTHPRAIPLAIGSACQGGDPYLVPSIVYVDGGRVSFGPYALRRAREGAGADPILSFKTILSASDAAAALNLKVPGNVDPTRTFTYKDVLTLYLAFLDQLVRRALGDGGAQLQSIGWRYTSPIWRSRDQAKSAFARTFDEAVQVSNALGPMLCFADGVSIAHARHALDLARNAQSLGVFEHEVYEGHAAAHAYAGLCPSPARAVLVFDIGAGTTDFAGFLVGPNDQSTTLQEFGPSRQCIGLAGDEIDKIIFEIAQRRFSPRTHSDARAITRMLAIEVREAKRQLFASGRCTLAAPSGGKVSIRRSELERHPLFRQFLSALSDAFRASYLPLAQEARARGLGEVSIILAGGGSQLPFLPALVSRVSGGCDIARFDETWGNHGAPLGSALAQVAISMGGALAPVKA